MERRSFLRFLALAPVAQGLARAGLEALAGPKRVIVSDGIGVPGVFFRDVAWDGRRFVVVVGAADSWTSPDGLQWTTISIRASEAMR